MSQYNYHDDYEKEEDKIGMKTSKVLFKFSLD